MAKVVITGEELKKDGTPVVDKIVEVIKFSAEWCKPCGFLANELKDIELEIKNVDVDTEEGQALSKQYKVRSIPLILFVDENGAEIHRHSGMISKKALTDIVDALLYDKVNPEYQELVAQIGSPQEDNKLFIYTQVLDFGRSPLNSLDFLCDGVKTVTEYGTNQTNITDFVGMLNSDPQPNGQFTAYGNYFDNGDGRVRLEAFPEVFAKYCSTGKMSLEAFWD
jgi:thiol-disulfide isomerase/thioredoxin